MIDSVLHRYFEKWNDQTKAVQIYLKIGLSGIVKRYGFKTVHDFYKTFAVAKTANAEYQEESDRWEELYGDNAQKQEKESIHKRLQNYQRENADRQTIRTSKNKDKGAR